MADIQIYGKFKSASGGKLVDYGAVENAPEVVQVSGDSTDKVMSQAATMAAIRQILREFGAFRFCGDAVSADRDSAGNVTTLYRQADLSLKFSDAEGDVVTIPGTDGETGTPGIFTVPDGYAYTVNGRTSPSVEFYRGTDIKIVVYDSDASMTVETLTELDGVSASDISFSTVGDYSVYSKTVTVPVIPSNGNVWQLGEREYAWNGTEWVELGFNFTADMSGVYTKTEADKHFATKAEVTSQVSAITAESLGALRKETSSGAGRVYGIKGDGTQVIRVITGKNIDGGTILYRESDGTCRMKDPVSDLDIANKRFVVREIAKVTTDSLGAATPSYVDSAIAAALGAAESALSEV